LGTAAPEIGEGVRLFPYKRWVILFRYEPHGVDVLRFADASQDYLSWNLPRESGRVCIIELRRFVPKKEATMNYEYEGEDLLARENEGLKQGLPARPRSRVGG